MLYADTDNILRCCRFDAEKSLWTKENMDGPDFSDVVLHPSSRIAGVLTASGVMVFFQNPGCVIECIQYDAQSTSWKRGFAVPGASAESTPLWVFLTDSSLVVSYVGEDKRMHCHTRDFETGNWTGMSVYDWNIV